MIHLALLLLYTLLALAFPRAMTRCGNVLVERPGLTLLTGLLTVLALPFLFVLLLVTVIGIPVALLALPLAIVSLFVFGKASVYGLIGRKITGGSMHPAACVLIGGLLVLVVSMVPILGLAASILLSALGFCCAATALFTTMQRPAAPKPAAPPPAPGPIASATDGPPAAAPLGTPAAPATSAATAEPPPLPAASQLPPPLGTQPAHASPAHGAPQVSFVGLPRAGFWIRLGALVIDLILVAIVTAPFRHVINVSPFGNNVSIDSPGMLPLVALYGALMWKLRGTTVGGIIFGLKVVRLDDRPIDWATAIVRALGCFLSLIVLGLGFIWVAFDQEKQSWHDKIAGTVVVRVPKGVSLI
jgi:uncharacterized RDD family membrane protein YckC